MTDLRRLLELAGMTSPEQTPQRLYHGTAFEYAAQIIDDDILYAPDEHDHQMDRPGVSLSTSYAIAQRFAANKERYQSDNTTGAVLVFDAPKLLRRYPHEFRDTVTLWGHEEEVWIDGNITDVKDYLVEIAADFEDAQEALGDNPEALQSLQRWLEG